MGGRIRFGSRCRMATAPIGCSTTRAALRCKWPIPPGQMERGWSNGSGKPKTSKNGAFTVSPLPASEDTKLFRMRITLALFEAHLKCATKCWLRSTGESTSGNAYAEWVQTQTDSYRTDATKRVMEALPADECVVAPAAENLKAAKWRLAMDV